MAGTGEHDLRRQTMAIDQLMFCSKIVVVGDGDDEIISWAAAPSSQTGTVVAIPSDACWHAATDAWMTGSLIQRGVPCSPLGWSATKPFLAWRRGSQLGGAALPVWEGQLETWCANFALGRSQAIKLRVRIRDGMRRNHDLRKKRKKEERGDKPLGSHQGQMAAASKREMVKVRGQCLLRFG
jgi:hypothetical protein